MENTNKIVLTQSEALLRRARLWMYATLGFIALATLIAWLAPHETFTELVGSTLASVFLLVISRAVARHSMNMASRAKALAQGRLRANQRAQRQGRRAPV